MGDALVLLSGGQDSTTCLFWAKQKFDKVFAIGFDYGQRHKAELYSAEKICKQANVSFEIISTPEINHLCESSLTRESICVQPAKKSGEIPNTIVEGRNALFLTYAAIYAKARGIRDIVIGVSQTDYSGYPDCRDEFIKSMNQTINLGLDYKFQIHTPLMFLSKADEWMLADTLGVLEIVYSKTLTCYNGIIGEGCGNCPACALRKKGYDEFLRIKGEKKCTK